MNSYKVFFLSLFFVSILYVPINSYAFDLNMEDLVYNNDFNAMAGEDVNPVSFPHWLHRIWFKCKVCHNRIFKPKKGANDLTMSAIEKGKTCGVCHNGKISFGVKDKGNCKRCHSLNRDGKFDGPKLLAKNINSEEIKKISKRFGTKWEPSRLGKKDIPTDEYGFVDWVTINNSKMIEPVSSLDSRVEDKVRDTAILFVVKSDFVNNILFSHYLHSSLMECDMCHEKYFKSKLGANKIRMRNMAASQNFCLKCHGVVSFPPATCTRCHKWKKDAAVMLDGDKSIIERHENEDAVILE